MKASKQITFNYLDELREGSIFKGVSLWKIIVAKAGKMYYPDTILRYMREWRKRSQTHTIILISKPESIYQKVAKI